MKNRYKIFFSFLGGFIATLLVSEFLRPSFGFQGNDDWTIRQIRENTALEMHIEDIWLHGRSTLKVFDPLSCSIKNHRQWWARWNEVTCISEDTAGQRWRYTVNYGVSSHYLNALNPSLEKKYLLRELKKLATNEMER